MIGADPFSTVFGGEPVHTAEHLSEHLRAIIRAGFSPILLKPGTKLPACVLSQLQAKRADKEAQDQALMRNPAARVDKVRHECGLRHVLDDPAKIGAIAKRWIDRYGSANIGLHLGRSRLLAVDVDTPDERQAFESDWYTQLPYGKPPSMPGITVESPGSYDPVSREWKHYGGGHWVFQLPPDFPLPPGKVLKDASGWAAMWGEAYILVPPSERPEGRYTLVGGAPGAPAWLLDRIHAAGQERARLQASTSLAASTRGGPIDQWSAYVSWTDLLEPDGWSDTQTLHTCGCPNWTAPGDHSNPRSATAHEPWCGKFDVSEGWGPLHIWTDHPPEGLPPEGTVTKLQYVALTRHGGDVAAATSALAIPRPPVASLSAFAPPGDDVMFGRPGSPGPTEPADAQGIEPASEGRVLDSMIDANDLDDIPEAIPLLDGVLDRSTIAVLVGKFGTYKTFLALDWAACLATGKPWAGHQVPVAVPVLYVAAEGATGIRKRLKAWTRTNGSIPRGGLTVITVAARLTEWEEVNQLDIALKRTGAKFLVLDTLHKVAPGMEENSSQDMGKMLGLVNLLRERNDVTVLILHHTGYAGERARGSSAFEDDVDSSFVIKIPGEDRGPDQPRTLHHRKSKDDELLPPLTLTFQPVEGSSSGILSTDPFHAPKLQGFSPGDQRVIAVIAALDAAGEPYGLGRRKVIDAAARAGIDCTQAVAAEVVRLRVPTALAEQDQQVGG